MSNVRAVTAIFEKERKQKTTTKCAPQTQSKTIYFLFGLCRNWYRIREATKKLRMQMFFTGLKLIDLLYDTQNTTDVRTVDSRHRHRDKKQKSAQIQRQIYE